MTEVLTKVSTVAWITTTWREELMCGGDEA
jgi:hypothetical protein